MAVKIFIPKGIMEKIDDLNKRELLFFALGGFVVYMYMDQDR